MELSFRSRLRAVFGVTRTQSWVGEPREPWHVWVVLLKGYSFPLDEWSSSLVGNMFDIFSRFLC